VKQTKAQSFLFENRYGLTASTIVLICYIPLYWVDWKRNHDINNSTDDDIIPDPIPGWENLFYQQAQKNT